MQRQENGMTRSFRLFKDLGHDVSIVFARQSGAGTVETEISHIEFDGINGFVHMLKTSGAFAAEGLPPLPQRAQRPLLGQIWVRLAQYVRTVVQFGRKGRAWRAGGKPVTEFLRTWHFLSLEETQAIRRAAATHRVSTNSYLLHHLHQALRPELQASSLPSAYIVPASLYERWDDAMTGGNRTSIMEVNLVDSDTPATVHAKLRREIDLEAYWGPWIGALVNALLPDALNRAILRSTVATKKRVATFTNLGRWQGGDPSGGGEAWCVLPPVHPGQPLGVGAIEYNGRLGLGLKLDPALGRDRADAERLLQSWVQRSLEGETAHA